ncbi:hypothetical protein O1611_g9990 [Lasiodiplodia mahajangana]|uniref:Uncharacterized protein n=1 Tax=Lasiodiplodia mahajangana TaxID=1108764 RepID=A0ACC2J376_9PEZI|nr:hypothetical protein O1611_g9990 [Lasiodiplodia mahajangana]
MRYSLASQALCGAVTVSALAVPNSPVEKRVQHVDISSFKSFPTADPQEFFDKADDSIRGFFDIGMFNDGPMDEAGKWLDRPQAILEDIGDKLELHFENLEEKIEDYLESLTKDQGKNAVKAAKSQIKGRVDGLSKAIDPLPDLNDFFGLTTKKPSPAQELPQIIPDISKDADNSEAAATCNPSNSHVRFEWDDYTSSRARATATRTSSPCTAA